jgi:hypothetical protein
LLIRTSQLFIIAVELKLEKNLIKHTILIANIPIEGILGMDYLEINNCDVLISKSCIRYRGNEIHCFKNKNNGEATCCRIGIYENIVLPPSSETIVAGRALSSNSVFLKNMFLARNIQNLYWNKPTIGLYNCFSY